MQEPCRSCERRAIDFGGCRCQAFALTGDAAATDPACTLSPRRAEIDAAHARASADASASASADADGKARRYLYRGAAGSSPR
jgi:pyrroloquinoline quinone biosynthesis protein E